MCRVSTHFSALSTYPAGLKRIGVVQFSRRAARGRATVSRTAAAPKWRVEGSVRLKNDDMADALSTSSTASPPSAAYRRVLDALRELNPDDHQIARRMKDTRVPELDNRTLEEAVLAGDAEKALRYLDAIATGWDG